MDSAVRRQVGRMFIPVTSEVTHLGARSALDVIRASRALLG